MPTRNGTAGWGALYTVLKPYTSTIYSVEQYQCPRIHTSSHQHFQWNATAVLSRLIGSDNAFKSQYFRYQDWFNFNCLEYLWHIKLIRQNRTESHRCVYLCVLTIFGLVVTHDLNFWPLTSKSNRLMCPQEHSLSTRVPECQNFVNTKPLEEYHQIYNLNALGRHK